MKIKPAARSVGARSHSDYYQEYLLSPAWALTRRAALERAGHRCDACEATRELEVHHRHYRTLGAEAPGDLAVYCRMCHLAADRRRAVARRGRR